MIRSNLSHRPSHIDGNLSYRPSHDGAEYMERSSDEESAFPNNFWLPENICRETTKTKQENKDEDKTDINNNSRC